MTTRQQTRARQDWLRKMNGTSSNQSMAARYHWEHSPAYALYKPQPVAAYIAARKLFMAAQGVYMPVTLPIHARIPA
jgi:hypothetical protein